MKLTMQQMFDTVLVNLTLQGVASTTACGYDEDTEGDASVCRYRGDEGRKCAAGHLILDEHYNPAMEGQIVKVAIVTAALIKSGAPDTPEALAILERMQEAHDNHMPGCEQAVEHTLEDFHTYMRSIAQDFGLEFKP